MASRSAETAVLISGILARERIGRHDGDPRVIVPEDRVIARPGDRHAVGAVLAQSDAMAPAASEKDELDLALRPTGLRDGKRQLRKLERLADIEAGKRDLGGVRRHAGADHTAR